MPRALPAPVQRAVRGAERPDRPRRGQLQAEHVQRDHRARGEVLGRLLLLHEPEADVRSHVPRSAAGGDDV